jgi:hypothetical protein
MDYKVPSGGSCPGRAIPDLYAQIVAYGPDIIKGIVSAGTRAFIIDEFHRTIRFYFFLVYLGKKAWANE